MPYSCIIRWKRVILRNYLDKYEEIHSNGPPFCGIFVILRRV